jgi:competence protein ComEA
MDSTKQDILKAFYPTFIGVLIGLVLGGLLWIVVRTPRGESVSLQPPATQAPMVVDVSGAVPRPGVYDLPDGSRVKDAVQAAGGFLASADKATINLAAPLEDGQKLEIPFISGLEPTPISVASTDNGGVPGPLIDINTATLEELDTLPGIGPTLAQAIIDYREQNGPFLSIEDIMFVEGIGPAKFELIKALITVGI